MNRKLLVSCLALVLIVLAAYANHFQNQFHFDDSHTITGNPAVRSLRNIPRFFTDAHLFSTMPSAATYRPFVSTTLALDYRIGKDNPFFFHVSTFLWFCVQLILMVFLFQRIMDLADPQRSGSGANFRPALFAAACYGLHPAGAETVNYIIQRGDLYDTLGVVASLLWFLARPAQRKYCWYLLPAVLAYLSKAPALIFPLILLAYLYLFEREAIRQAIPAFVVTILAAILTAGMTPATYNPGATSAALYRLTQPWVSLHYFRSFFVPTQLAVDSHWEYVHPLSLQALAGYLFVLAMLAAAVWSSRRRETRPIAFGITWFFLALLPTSLLPLADVMNDHRMFFPFVGLALAVVWGITLGVRLLLPGRIPVRLIAGLAAMVLVAEAAGTWQRNQVWRTEESLWRDAVHKNPLDDRARDNYHRAFLVRGNYQKFMADLEHEESLHPADADLQVDMALANAILEYDAEADRHFQRAESLAPGQARTYCSYGRWLRERGRLAESQQQLEKALQLKPGYQEAQTLLTQVKAMRLAASSPPDQNATALLNQSARDCQSGRYTECMLAASQALKVRPGWVEAYNNLSVAFLAMQKWDEGIEAARKALAIRPDDDTAKSNLQWALEHKPK